MAAFTDQFQRYDPRSIDEALAGPFHAAVAVMSLDACEYLGQAMTVADMTAACEAMELELCRRISPKLFQTHRELGEAAVLHDILMVAVPGLFPDRHDLALAWLPYACLALWKLVDVCDAYRRNGGSNSDLTLAAGNLVVASKALQICAALVSRDATSLHWWEKDEARRSAKARARVNRRWMPRNEHRAFAIAMSSSIRSWDRIKVARTLADKVEEKFGKRYGDDTVDGWLKDANWQPPAR
jgi:hypothetical protein